MKLFHPNASVPALLSLALLTGCGGGGGGPQRYSLTGKVTHGGEPVAVGEIHFEPNAAKGTEGPGSVVEFKDGTYSLDAEKGVVGGEYKVIVHGFDGVKADDHPEADPRGTQLFAPYEIEVSLPAENATKDFDVPKS